MPTFDPFDADQVQNAWPLLRSLRDQGAVVTVANDLRYVTRHAEAKAALRDASAFSNASGFKAPGVVVPVEDRTLGELDAPQHGFVRRVMVGALTPRVVHGAEAFTAEAARALLEPVAAAGRADLVTAYTVPLPNRVTVHLLGLDDRDADMISRWAKELMESGFPATNRNERGEGFAAAFPEFAGYIDDQIERRAGRDADPQGDVISRLANLEIEGERLSRRQVRAMVRNLITGGFTTTSQLLGNLIHQLLTVDGLEAAMRGDPAVIDRAVEESLRLTPPVLLAPRGCVADTTIGGCPIAAGERVVVGIASANRDERVFDDPDVFVVDRPNADHHLAFGFGPHVCPGATLARAVGRIGIAELLARFPAGTLRFAPGYERVNVPTFFEWGPRTLDVVTTAS